MSTPFFSRYETMAPGDFSDELHAFAFNIEQTLIQAGAEPGKDYTQLDIIKLAQPFVLQKIKDGIQIELEYPAEKIIPQN